MANGGFFSNFGDLAPRKLLIYVQNLLLLLISFYSAYWIRTDFSTINFWFKSLLPSAVIYASITLVIGLVLGLYSNKFVPGSFEEMLGINTQALIALTVVSVFRLNELQDSYPRSIPILASLIYVFFALGIRTIIRLRIRFLQRKRVKSQKNILIYGAGSLGNHIANLVLLDSNLNLVGFVDDNSSKSNLMIRGKKILGASKELDTIIKNHQVNQLILAISSLNDSQIDFVKTICLKNGVNLKQIPSAESLISGIYNLQELISYNEKSLLGRSPVEINRSGINNLLKDKVILITGAGGSIGSEIAKQCVGFSPKEVLLLDRDETSLHTLELELFGTGNLQSKNIILADIRDKQAMYQIFEKFRPNVVFHAAALKHLAILENYPDEAYKTNIQGTENILDACTKNQVEILVNISTDKAADPKSILGKSKLEAEKLTLHYSLKSENSNAKYISVRFGNVVGSRGSVLHTFKYQIDNNLSVTITDPDVTRYFMTVHEAVSLVLQSSLQGRTGETLILDMGKPVKIFDVAKFMIDQSGKDIPIIFTGLRNGEKLHETLHSETESLITIEHPKIYHTKVPIEASRE
jgi:dTDP-glucose 4,6-dehydratase